ncbi:unnamed protein product, partial [Anisakis simplex]|uniref:UBC core domain-containing protein n=1 Tax=Anisakis simplex TaxID=6269 RepID=A0A0M3JNP8_ANISI
ETPPHIVASLCGKLEGTVCTRYASQQEVRQFLAIPLHFERVLEQPNGSAQDYKTDKRGSSGGQLSFRFTSGVLHRFDAHLRMPEGYPGTLQTKNTYVEYVISVRVSEVNQLNFALNSRLFGWISDVSQPQ